MRKFLLLGLFLFTPLFAALPPKFIGCLYDFKANQLTARWDAMPGATGYEARLVWIDKNITYPAKAVVSPLVIFTQPRAGHFAVEVRASYNGNWSSWSSSTVAGKVDGTDMPWIFYWELPPAGGVIISKDASQSNDSV